MPSLNNSGTMSNMTIGPGRTSLQPNDPYIVNNSGAMTNVTFNDAGPFVITNTGTMKGNFTLGVGNDTYNGKNGLLFGAILSGGGQDKLYGGAGSDVFNAGAANDLLSGGAGNDTLNGSSGGDLMQGGAGNDSYYVDNTGDRLDESLAGSNGADKVYSSISLSLANTVQIKGAVENLALTGTANINALGTGLSNAISGNSGHNQINGGGGNDLINGGAGNDLINGSIGNDRLAGSTGNDSFIFNAVPNATTNLDTVLDYNVAADTIRVDNAVFGSLGATTGTLNAAMFWKSTTGLAHDSNDRIIYETDTGKLFYDSNGSAAGGSIQFAALSAGLTLTNADFLVI